MFFASLNAVGSVAYKDDLLPPLQQVGLKVLRCITELTHVTNGQSPPGQYDRTLNIDSPIMTGGDSSTFSEAVADVENIVLKNVFRSVCHHTNGLIGPDTRFSFRSSCTHTFLMIQVSEDVSRIVSFKTNSYFIQALLRRNPFSSLQSSGSGNYSICTKPTVVIIT